MLDETREGDAIKFSIKQLRRDFELDEDVTASIPDFRRFKAELNKLQYVATLAAQEAED